MFMAFSSLSLSGFGGVMPFAYRALVEKLTWIEPSEFASMVGVAQVLPGPTICNLSVMVGLKKSGRAGALTALLGMILGPMIIVLVLGLLFERYGGVATVQAALRGMSAVAAGLIFATAVKMGRSVFLNTGRSRTVSALMVLWCALAFIAVGLIHWPLALVVFALAPAAVATAWWGKA
jgi:chromate transporter